MSDSDRDFAIEECLQEIETIKNDSAMSPQLKRDLIERNELQLGELRGESADTK
jgi:hypothetical protein